MTNEQKEREAFEAWARDHFLDDIEATWETWKAALESARTKPVSVDDAQTAFYKEMRRQGFKTEDIDHIDSGDLVKAVLDAAGVKYVD